MQRHTQPFKFNETYYQQEEKKLKFLLVDMRKLLARVIGETHMDQDQKIKTITSKGKGTRETLQQAKFVLGTVWAMKKELKRHLNNLGFPLMQEIIEFFVTVFDTTVQSLLLTLVRKEKVIGQLQEKSQEKCQSRSQQTVKLIAYNFAVNQVKSKQNQAYLQELIEVIGNWEKLKLIRESKAIQKTKEACISLENSLASFEQLECMELELKKVDRLIQRVSQNSVFQKFEDTMKESQKEKLALFYQQLKKYFKLRKVYADAGVQTENVAQYVQEDHERQDLFKRYANLLTSREKDQQLIKDLNRKIEEQSSILRSSEISAGSLEQLIQSKIKLEHINQDLLQNIERYKAMLVENRHQVNRLREELASKGGVNPAKALVPKAAISEFQQKKEPDQFVAQANSKRNNYIRDVNIKKEKKQKVGFSRESFYPVLKYKNKQQDHKSQDYEPIDSESQSSRHRHSQEDKRGRIKRPVLIEEGQPYSQSSIQGSESELQHEIIKLSPSKPQLGQVQSKSKKSKQRNNPVVNKYLEKQKPSLQVQLIDQNKRYKQKNQFVEVNNLVKKEANYKNQAPRRVLLGQKSNLFPGSKGQSPNKREAPKESLQGGSVHAKIGKLRQSQTKILLAPQDRNKDISMIRIDQTQSTKLINLHRLKQDRGERLTQQSQQVIAKRKRLVFRKLFQFKFKPSEVQREGRLVHVNQANSKNVQTEAISSQVLLGWIEKIKLNEPLIEKGRQRQMVQFLLNYKEPRESAALQKNRQKFKFSSSVTVKGLIPENKQRPAIRNASDIQRKNFTYTEQLEEEEEEKQKLRRREAKSQVKKYFLLTKNNSLARTICQNGASLFDKFKFREKQSRNSIFTQSFKFK